MLFTKVLKRSGWLRSEGHQPPLPSIQTPKMSPEQPYYDSSSGGWRSSFPLNFSPVARRGAWVRGRAYLSLPVLTCCTWFQPVWVSESLTSQGTLTQYSELAYPQLFQASVYGRRELSSFLQKKIK